MRSSCGFVLVTTLVGCAAGATGTPRDLPDAPAAMPADGATGDVSPPANPSFQIVGPTVTVDANHEITYCYYFRTPNTSDVAIKKWVSRMTPGAHDIVMYLTPGDIQAAGTLSTDKCGFQANGVVIGPVWAYSADSPDNQVVLPADDGNGMPVGQLIAAGRSAFLQMHFVNSTAAVLHSHVELDAYAYDAGVQVTPAGSFYTYSTKIDLAPGSAANPTTGTVVSNDVPPRGCIVPAGAKFYLMSVHTHKQAVHTLIRDGAAMVFESKSWEQPGAATWSAPPFYTFTSGKLGWQCEYVNPNNRRIQSGDDAAMAETCMAVGYFFPSPGGAGAFCLDSAMIN